MNLLIFNHPAAAWLVLVAATFCLWGLSIIVGPYFMLVAILVSGLKVALIGLNFMEVQFAKTEVYRFFLLWVGLVTLLFLMAEIYR
ncbi:hypothetical protein [Halioxenophilus aromaticivorans]|uniref:hypothetical protein n=1 Tax=Halioxenophilus aromaticivorans TaxID=1306992 RepID=UPI0031F088F4